MNKERLNYAWSKGLTLGIYFAITTILIDIFYYRVKGVVILKNVLYYLLFFAVAGFIWAYFEYKLCSHKQEEKKKI
ncbi:MAG: hypothetical protein V1674_03110 [Candidatus Omnitrophota bacterium]